MATTAAAATGVGSFCLANLTASAPPPLFVPQLDAQHFRSVNPVLPAGVSVGFWHNASESNGEEVPVVCLGEDPTHTICYKNQPSVHRVLSLFDPTDYLREDYREYKTKEDTHETRSPTELDDDEYEIDDDDEDDKVEKIVEMTLEDLPNLVPGMMTRCMYEIDKPDQIFDAIYLETGKKEDNEEHLIGIVYYEPGYESKWVPYDWCTRAYPAGQDDEKLWPCEKTETSPSEGGDEHESSVQNSWKCDYMTDGDNPLFHRAFRSLMQSSPRKKQKPNDPDDNPQKVLFLYTNTHELVDPSEWDPDTLEGRVRDVATPAGMDTTQYDAIYRHMFFGEDIVEELDNKYLIYQLYKDDPKASAVFPKTYVSYKEALRDTFDEHLALIERDPGDEEDDDESENNKTMKDVVFYVKGSGSTRGEEISIFTWTQLHDWWREHATPGYDAEFEGDDVIQTAVTDLYTIDGDGPIAHRRFDIRFFVVIAHGEAYLHANMWCKWVYGPEYDPNDTDVKKQVSNLAVYGGGDTARLIFPDVREDARGRVWRDASARRREGVTPPKHRGADPHGWRDALADALDDVAGVFSHLREHTLENPTDYVLAGGDAMIREDGTAVIVEFNIWCDLASKYYRLNECLAGEGCRRMVLLVDRDDEDADAVDNYHVTEQTPVTDIVSAEALAGVLRDTAALVMQAEALEELPNLRRIVTREN